MASDLSKLNFADDLAAARKAPDASRWVLEHRGDLELWVTVSPDGHDAEKFVARLLWTEYPGDLPPSVKFVDPTTERLDVRSAWPIARAFRPDSFDICATWTAEGFTLHPEWRKDPTCRWPTDGNSILRSVRLLQHELDLTYQGRCKA